MSLCVLKAVHAVTGCNFVCVERVSCEHCGLLMQVIDKIAKERKLQRPSVSYGAENLYMHGPLEELTRQNLTKVNVHLCFKTTCFHNNCHKTSAASNMLSLCVGDWRAG